jgi:hypothetical protein
VARSGSWSRQPEDFDEGMSALLDGLLRRQDSSS